MFNRFQDAVARIWFCELVLSAQFAASGDKIFFFAGIDPQRNVMRESLSNWPGRDWHGRDAALRRPRIGIDPCIHLADGAARRPYHGASANWYQALYPSRRRRSAPSLPWGVCELVSTLASISRTAQ